MNIFKTSLLAATALTLMGGAASAQAINFSNTTQDGNGNSALVSQEQLTSRGAGNAVGTAGRAVLQDGSDNVLVIEQLSSSDVAKNSVGGNSPVNAETFEGFAGGFVQRGNNNEAIVQQGANDGSVQGNNVVTNVLQSASGTAGADAPNTLDVAQTSKGSAVTNVRQSQTGSADATNNTLLVNQTGVAANNGRTNLINDIEQVGTAGVNALVLSQTATATGAANRIGSLT
ncbi:hypothetical protein U0C82_03980 [Fulvimarina sp. 2208YS6-2-32]|uniref:Curlin associated repeat-containing protein n=1 Tax=Fulvimarina uroteuthidis TaxID=3098149 RepID=A0ABU5I0H8_9HYPH|nr:hypothetical protein [Fulvimarina sp. 2208YS6-2-32]MDY8108309.1 hypothetical protein [Fulvimarina sp. 2208YS6-2-32]